MSSLILKTDSPEETRQLGEKLGRQLKKGMVLALYGDLGSGKTVFVQGLARGLRIAPNQYITSPTYTLVNEYSGVLSLFHVDLYRLENTIEFEDIGLDEILYGEHVVAVEWADRLHNGLPPEHLKIEFSASADDTHSICITAYGLESENLLKSLKVDV